MRKACSFPGLDYMGPVFPSKAGIVIPTCVGMTIES